MPSNVTDAQQVDAALEALKSIADYRLFPLLLETVLIGSFSPFSRECAMLIRSLSISDGSCCILHLCQALERVLELGATCILVSIFTSRCMLGTRHPSPLAGSLS